MTRCALGSSGKSLVKKKTEETFIGFIDNEMNHYLQPEIQGMNIYSHSSFSKLILILIWEDNVARVCISLLLPVYRCNVILQLLSTTSVY